MTTTFRRWSAFLAGSLAAVLLVGGLLPAGPARAEEQKAAGFGSILGDGLNKATPDAIKSGSQPDLNKIIGGIISQVITFLGAILLILLLYGGFLYMTAQGDGAQVKKATGIIRDAIIGLVIVASSYAIATKVIDVISTATKASQ